MFKSRGNWCLGLMIVGLGIIFLLGNFDLIAVSASQIIRTYWPVILLLIGANVLTSNRDKGGYVSALIFIGLGLLFLGRNMGLYFFDIRYFWRIFWPVVLILLGISFLRGPQARGRSNWAIMGSVKRAGSDWKLESGSYWAIMGGVELDLRQAIIGAGEYYLNCNALMGGVEVIIPPDLNVRFEGTAVLGGVEFLDKGNGGIFATVATQQEGGAAGAVIHIFGRAFMGGVEVKVRKSL